MRNLFTAYRFDPPHPGQPSGGLRVLLFAALVLGIVSSPASAVLLISGNGNTSAPTGADDPGFAHVGQKSSGGLTLTYLGNGWVLTAAHVREADFRLNSVVYSHVPGSGVQFVNNDGSPADLLAFKILGSPELPDLPILEIASVSPRIGAAVIMIGRGYNRDGTTAWNELETPFTLRKGWLWGSTGGAIRWGTNRVADPADLPAPRTDNFIMDFTKPGDSGATVHEAQAVIGDSGGAVFMKLESGGWVLTGVMFTVSGYSGQPFGTALEGNFTYSVDLARFRDQIIPLVRPECSDEIDNDGDGELDYPGDPSCSSPEDLSEANSVPAVGTSALGMLGSLLVASVLAKRTLSDPSA